MVAISSLTYCCTQRKDGAEGSCKIRQLPPEVESIQRWLAKLPLGDDFEYKGEGSQAYPIESSARCCGQSVAAPRRQIGSASYKSRTAAANSVAAFSTETLSGTS